jgi:hypothetical protein
MRPLSPTTPKVEADLELVVRCVLSFCVSVLLDADRYPPVTIRCQAMDHKRKTYWPQAHYWCGSRIDSKKLAKVKAGTKKIQTHCVKDSVVALKFENEETNMYGFGVMIVGRAKKENGAVLVTTYSDGREEHVHHGK